MATDPTVQAAAEALEDACLTHLGRDLGTIHRDEIAAVVVIAVTPLIRAQAFTEAADTIQTTRTGGGWENNINIGLHKAELLVRGLGEGTA